MLLEPPAKRIAFFLVPNFSMIAFATAIEPLRLANRTVGRSAYRWTLVSEDGQPVTASNGLTVTTDMDVSAFERQSLDQGGPDLVLVCAGLEVERYRSQAVEGWLRRTHHRSVKIGGLCTGAWVLARAGLLRDRKCAVHWESLPGFTETFPDVEASADLFEVDGPLYTCAGGTASLDLLLHMIAEDLGNTVATHVCEQCLTDRIRSPNDHQRLPLRVRLGVHNIKLLSVIELMEANLAEPLTLVELSHYVGLSRRQIERLFERHLGRSPKRYYLELRLSRARDLLLQSSMSIVDVAVACGFVSASHFSKCYRHLYGRSPKMERLLQAAGGLDHVSAEEARASTPEELRAAVDMAMEEEEGSVGTGAEAAEWAALEEAVDGPPAG